MSASDGTRSTPSSTDGSSEPILPRTSCRSSARSWRRQPTRPLELIVEGFRSYRERATFDFRGRRLVGVVGPIGSGKSSMLDAISFALYGKTPLVERDTKSLIHQLRDTCQVELRFTVDGQVCSAVRVLRRKGQAGHKLELLSSYEPGAETLEIVNGERAMNDRIEQLLGLDFKAFSRSVMLAQNQFAEFLNATPGDRDKVLKGVFGYERLDEALRVARLHVDRAGMELEGLAKEASDAQAARADLAEAKERELSTGGRLTALRQVAPKVDELAERRAEAARAAEAATAKIVELEAIANDMPSREEIEETVDAAIQADGRLDEANAAAEEAEVVRAAAEAKLKDTESRVGDRSRFGTFAALVTRQEQQAQAVMRERERLEIANAGRARAAEAAERAATELAGCSAVAALEEGAASEAETAVMLRRDELLDARHAEMAFELRGALVVGESCPVCAQPVHALPKKAPAPKVRAAEQALRKAETAEAKARGRRDASKAKVVAATTAAELALEALEGAEQTYAQAERDSGQADAALAATKSEIVDRLGEGDPRELLEEREAELAAAESARDGTARAAREAREEVERVRAGAADITERLARMANRLAGIWGRLGEKREVTSAPETVRTEFEDTAGAVAERRDRTRSELAAAEGRVVSALEELSTLFAEIDLPPDADFVQELTSATVAQANAERDVKELERIIKAAGKIQQRIDAAEARRTIADRLARDLQPSRFLAFLLEEERAELGELGSEHLEQLTAGSYRFTADDAFNILDLNAAGTERRAGSLSGGETFLASLALALALAEMVARGGGRLDAFFLDEGFGSLDPEHLDRAMEGIGHLVAGSDDRLVVLVSHVSEMREAIEDLVILDKDPITGDTIVVSGGTPEVLTR